MAKITKSESLEAPAVPAALIGTVTEHVFPSKPVKTSPCRICSAPGATVSSGGLCWVCRRLKVSAWQGSDVHDAAGE